MSKKSVGSSFEDFLREEAMLDDATAVALKRVFDWQNAENMKARQLTESAQDDAAERTAAAAAGLSRAYGDDEPEYSLSDLRK